MRRAELLKRGDYRREILVEVCEEHGIGALHGDLLFEMAARGRVRNSIKRAQLSPPEKLYCSLRVGVLTRLMQVGSQDAGGKQDAPGKQRKRRGC
jgi:hypothetical protein